VSLILDLLSKRFNKLKRVGGRAGREATDPVKEGESAGSADLGGSSKYSSENLED